MSDNDYHQKHHERHERRVAKRIATVILTIILLVIAVALWQDHTNSLSYRLRNCLETSANSGYIGFTCTDRYNDKTQIFLPESERDQVKNLLMSNDKQRLY